LPRLSRGVVGAGENALSRDLMVLHRAVDMYAMEHGGVRPESARIEAQLTQYTCCRGNPSVTKDPNYVLGPYLRVIPPVPVGPNRGSSRISDSPGRAVGWIYDAATGSVGPNLSP
jgi:hypothetical protein